MFIIKTKSGDMYKFQNDTEVRSAIAQFRQQGIRGNVYQCWGKSRYQIGNF